MSNLPVSSISFPSSDSNKPRPIHVLKPILKQSPSPVPHVEKHAHFPPPSEEAKRYSGVKGYDRSPIVVLTNECALPARGCPGRTFDETVVHKYHKRHSRAAELGGLVMPSVANHPHPCILNGSTVLLNGSSYPQPPPGREPGPLLTHFDTTSESEESDSVTSPLSEEDTVHSSSTSRLNAGLILGAARAAACTRRSHRPRRDTPRTRDVADGSPSLDGFAGNNSCLDGF